MNGETVISAEKGMQAEPRNGADRRHYFCWVEMAGLSLCLGCYLIL